MDGRGGCCIARYASDGGGMVYDISKMDRIMLRFRPIAPKPATGGGSVSPPDKGAEIVVKSGRGKRKYTREYSNVNKRFNINRKKKSSSGEKRESVVTLPLLPDSPARSSQTGSQDNGLKTSKAPMWLSFDKSTGGCEDQVVVPGNLGLSTDRRVVMAPQPVRVLGSCATVECVTDMWIGGDGLGSTDTERKMNLEKDACPGFISDGFGRVAWINEAYKKLVGQEACMDEVVVWLVVKVPVAVSLTCPAFSCRVRLQYTCGKEKSSLTVPCDVWRMDGGGFAWRLDVKAALCLGR